MKKYLLIIVSGALTALSIMFTPLSFLAWFSLVPFVYYIIKDTESRANPFKVYLLGLVWSMSFYICIYHFFLYMYPMEFLGANPVEAVWLVALFWFGLSTLQGVVTALVPVVFRLCARHKVLYAPLFACIWIIFEWLQTQTWMGVPWARLAISQAELPVFIQSASLLGSLLISFLIALINALLATAFIAFRKDGLKAVGLRVCALTAAALFVTNLLFGAIVLALKNDDEDRKVTVILVQGNILSSEKWSADSPSPLDLYIDLSREALDEAGGRADIILWPETVINYYLLGSSHARSEISALAEESGAIVFAGTFDRLTDESGEKHEYNAVIAFYPDGSIEEEPYYKRRLVPFGEYLPMAQLIETLFPALMEMNLFGSDITPGEDSRIAVSDHGKIGRLICFDSLYEELTRQSVRDGAEIMMLSTNDSWFIDSAAVYLHNKHAILRSVENNRWMLRAANTGVSTIISSEGRVVEKLEPLVRGYVVGEACFSSDNSLYTYVGDMIVPACALFIAAEICLRIKEEIKRRRLEKRSLD